MTLEQEHFDLLEDSFPGIVANIERYEALGFSWNQSKPFVKKQGGEVLSHAGFLEFPMWVEGEKHQVGALHAICTQNTERSRGLATALVKEALEWAHGRVESVILFTEIPQFYEKLSFRPVQECRFHLKERRGKGSAALTPLTFPKDNALFIRMYQGRAPLSERLWIEDRGALAAFNSLFATYPLYWSLHYSSQEDAIFSFALEGKVLHLFDVVAEKIPSLDTILDHMPAAIEEIYFYFSPDLLTKQARAIPYLYDNGQLMLYGDTLGSEPFMIPPLSRC
ncbi:GNAT family N-acetyltransferase [Estrella lausannensis]|uniref:Acetyltransferase, GNAT family n=1 Tax=Estrella lausannensis TaxID=483423 RepID=A0A0H5DQE1_9BACT|nr:GNAT family N-acetyltransferase [Estrella lausannensis]CRX38288.1 Acetyltransferase, GNAT family [Estrella lausannensis]